jgi:hypothetical protein
MLRGLQLATLWSAHHASMGIGDDRAARTFPTRTLARTCRGRDAGELPRYPAVHVVPPDVPGHGGQGVQQWPSRGVGEAVGVVADLDG